MMFFNAARKLEEKDYERALQSIISRHASDEMAAIYDWGNPSQPGISDLDIVFVLKNASPRPLPLHKRSFLFLDEKIRYIARHPFLFISEGDFSRIRYVYPFGSLRRVWGKGIGIKKLAKDEEKEAAIALLSDIAIRHYPRDFLFQQMQKRINVRDSLLRLNSLKYTFLTLEKLMGKKRGTWSSFAKEVGALRFEWFETDDAKRNKMLCQLCERAIPIIMEIIDTTRNITAERFRPLLGHFPERVLYEGAKNKSVFLKKWNKDSSLYRMKAHIHSKGAHCSYLPMELCYHLLFYSHQGGRISSYIRAHLHPFQKIRMKNEVLAKRMAVLNNQAELANALRHSDFPAFFDFGYRAQRGINNCALRILDAIRK